MKSALDKIKAIIIGAAGFLIFAVLWPFRKKSSLLKAVILNKALRRFLRKGVPERNLQFLFELDRKIYDLEGQNAVLYGKGIHPKHRITGYHEFFTRNINPGERVLDIGCGNGIVDYEIATSVAGAEVAGIDISGENIRWASGHYEHPHLKFFQGDALRDLPGESFDVVILSNVLEHVDERTDFLKRIVSSIGPHRLLVRVPLFEREWRVPLKKELGVDYRLDETHRTEYTQESFLEEIRQAGLQAEHMEVRWGEIWAVVKPI